MQYKQQKKPQMAFSIACQSTVQMCLTFFCNAAEPLGHSSALLFQTDELYDVVSHISYTCASMCISAACQSTVQIFLTIFCNVAEPLSHSSAMLFQTVQPCWLALPIVLQATLAAANISAVLQRQPVTKQSMLAFVDGPFEKMPAEAPSIVNAGDLPKDKFPQFG